MAHSGCLHSRNESWLRLPVWVPVQPCQHTESHSGATVPTPLMCFHVATSERNASQARRCTCPSPVAPEQTASVRGNTVSRTQIVHAWCLTLGGGGGARRVSKKCVAVAPGGGG